MDDEGRVCTRCGKFKVWDDFPVSHGSRGRGATCLVCKQLLAKGLVQPRVPSPAVRLRCELERRRARGEDFLVAWPAARHVALRPLSGRSRMDWLEVFSAPEVRLAFYNAYAGWVEPMPLAGLVAEAV
jgi:hypothetical protein